MPTVLITGASTGIGRATALRLAAGGWTVLAGVRDAEAGERLVAAAGGKGGEGGEGAAASANGPRQIGGTLVPLMLDITDPGQVAAAARAVAEHNPGRLDALVNNAGIGVGGPLELVAVEDLRTQFEVNVFGQVAVTQALLGALRAARGRIVFVTSIGGRVAVPFNGPYAASKHALEALGDALRGELHSSGIAVSLVEPGSVKTPIWEKAQATLRGLKVPPELHAQYGDVPGAFAKVLHDTERRGVPPEQVAGVIERALTARRPRARYLVGRDARGMVLAKTLLPTRAFDRVVRNTLGLDRSRA